MTAAVDDIVARPESDRRTFRDSAGSGGSELNESPEGELGLEDDRAAAVQTADGDGVEGGQMERGGRVALLVDAVARPPRRPSLTAVVLVVHLLGVHTLDALLVAHVDAERPATRQVVVDQLRTPHSRRLAAGLTAKRRIASLLPSQRWTSI